MEKFEWISRRLYKLYLKGSNVPAYEGSVVFSSGHRLSWLPNNIGQSLEIGIEHNFAKGTDIWKARPEISWHNGHGANRHGNEEMKREIGYLRFNYTKGSTQAAGQCKGHLSFRNSKGLNKLLPWWVRARVVIKLKRSTKYIMRRGKITCKKQLGRSKLPEGQK